MLTLLTMWVLAFMVRDSKQDKGLIVASNIWRNITPLKNTRSDVERELGAPLEHGCHDCTYRTSTEDVFVSYSHGLCEGSLTGWNVPADTVIEFAVYPKRELIITATELKDQNLIRYSQDSFVLQDKGVAYTVEQLSQRIKQIRFLPTQADNKLRCRGFSSYNPAGVLYANNSVFRKKDTLSNLDILTTEAMNRPVGFVTYVIFYADKAMSDRAFEKLIKGYETHLYRRRKANPANIKLVKGGRRESFIAEVFIIRKDGPVPVPSPDFVNEH